MNGILTDIAVQRMLDTYAGHATEQDLSNAYAILFNAPTTVSDSTVIGSLTESSFPGYARILLSSAHWPGSTVTAHIASATYALPLVWTCTGGSGAQTVYGMALIDNTGTFLIAATLFDSGPYTMVNNGDTITETLTLANQSKY